MKKKKKFVVPGVLQVCEVALEGNLLGASQEFMQNSAIETTGHQIQEDNTYQRTTWGNTDTWID